MKNVKTRHSLYLSMGLVMALASCTQIEPRNSGDANSSVPVSSSLETKDAIVHGKPEDFKTGSLTLHLEHNAINEGNCFYDGCKPSLDYSGTDRSDRAIYTVLDKSGNPLPADEPLSEGSYYIRAKYGSYYTTGSFKVVKTIYTDVDNGEGYSQISENEAKATRLYNWDYVGALGGGKMESIGNPHLLVIPVTFTDTSFSSSELNELQKAYFGESEDTGWESLRSYYWKSSYGKLDITGRVTGVYQYPSTSLKFEEDYKNKLKDTSTIAQAAVMEMKRRGYDLSEFDNDKDGFLDGVELIYNSNRNIGHSDLWWCFTSSVRAKKPRVGEDPVLNRYFWSLSSQQRTNYYNPNIDAHTLIHETGHMLGLNDYYDYNGEGNPSGFVDMMDRNIGDHSAYSKYMLGWVNPKYVDGSKDIFTITLNSFTDTGDCLIVRNTSDDPWNKTPYDEYLMLEYYTPTGVNAKDSSGYPEWMSPQTIGTGGTFSAPGLKVSHIDNRLVSYAGDHIDLEDNFLSNKHATYTDELSNEFVYKEGTLTDKTPSFQISSNSRGASGEVINSSVLYGADIKENTLITPDGSPDNFLGRYAINAIGSQSHLFGTAEYGGGTFYSSYKVQEFFPNGLKWNDGSTLNYSWNIIAQDDSSITLRFYKNF
ncbi:MAG: hypothetical protein J6328_03655 [Bacilli bacterium]|nr:hypothetical protein [Bacilli bacterium]